MIKRFPPNPLGRDIIVGDIHGCFSKLNDELEAIDFDPAKDRLFSVGDLVDRGPESEQCLQWLEKDWFHAVQGNHEQMAVQYAAGDWTADSYARNGGAWFIGTLPNSRYAYCQAFMEMPLAIELETLGGLVCIVHAACDYPTWAEFKQAMERDEVAMENAVWGRRRWTSHATGSAGVSDVRAVVVGHTPGKQIQRDHNVINIDTGAVFMTGHFTLLDAATLQPVVKQ